MAEEAGWGTNDDIPGGEGEDFSFDGSGMSEDDVGGSAFLNKEGWYHFEVADVVKDLGTLNDKGKEKTPTLKIEMVVMHTVPGQCPANTRHVHKIYMGGKGGGAAAEGSKKSAMRFGLGAKIIKSITDGDGKTSLVDSKTGSTKINVDTFLRLKGMHLIGNIKHQEAKDDFGEKWELDYGRIYTPDDDFVAEVPKNVDILKSLGYANVNPGVMPGQGQAAGPKGKGPATSKKEPPPAGKDSGSARAEGKKEPPKEPEKPASDGIDLDGI